MSETDIRGGFNQGLNCSDIKTYVCVATYLCGLSVCHAVCFTLVSVKCDMSENDYDYFLSFPRFLF